MSHITLITGCSTGIGMTTALHLARRADHVYAGMRALDRSNEIRQALAREGLNAQILQLDVTDEEAVRAAVDFVISREGRIDAIVNNAGVAPFAPVERTTDADWLATLNTNLLGPVRLARAALPSMRSRHAGTIVNISSVAGRLAPVPTQPAYAASKHALCAFTDSLAAECTPFGISTYCIEPGFFSTAIMDKDTICPLDDTDPYKPLSDSIWQFFRDSVAAAPPPDAVAELVLAAIDGTIQQGFHYPVGMPGLGPTPSSARQPP